MPMPIGEFIEVHFDLAATGFVVAPGYTVRLSLSSNYRPWIGFLAPAIPATCGAWKLQIELLKLQAWMKENDQRIVLLFEDRDAAGKGGAIKHFTEHMNPRGSRIVALKIPTDREKISWYFQRYAAHLPGGGEIVMFDRSWYNRAGVEGVMGCCTPQKYLEFTRSAPEFERMLV